MTLFESTDLQGRMEQFARTHLSDGFPERERLGTFHREGWQACAREGILALPTRDSLEPLYRTLHALGRGTPDVGFLLSLNAHLFGCVLPLHQQKESRYLPDTTSGRRIGVHAITEPGAGSDLHATTTGWRREGDRYRIRGTKTFLTNAPIADLFLLYAKKEPVTRESPLSVFLVETKDPGVRLTKTFQKMGLRTAPMGEVEFDVLLPADRLLGREDSGMTLFHSALELERAGVSASFLGVMEAQLERTLQRARERRAFEKPIAAFQSVSNRLVEMNMRVTVGRLLLDKFISLKVAGKRAPEAASMLKLHVSEAFVQSSLDAVEIHGGLGYVEEGGIEHYLRDAVGGLLLSGTTDIQRATIARMMGLTTG